MRLPAVYLTKSEILWFLIGQAAAIFALFHWQMWPFGLFLMVGLTVLTYRLGRMNATKRMAAQKALRQAPSASAQ